MYSKLHPNRSICDLTNFKFKIDSYNLFKIIFNSVGKNISAIT